MSWVKGNVGVARHAGVSPRTAARWLESGELPARRLSARMIMVRKEDIDKFLERAGTLHRARRP